MSEFHHDTFCYLYQQNTVVSSIFEEKKELTIFDMTQHLKHTKHNSYSRNTAQDATQ